MRVVERKAKRDSGAERMRDNDGGTGARVLEDRGGAARLRSERVGVALGARGMAHARAVVGDDAVQG
jgi:hypothetical protein